MSPLFLPLTPFPTYVHFPKCLSLALQASSTILSDRPTLKSMYLKAAELAKRTNNTEFYEDIANEVAQKLETIQEFNEAGELYLV